MSNKITTVPVAKLVEDTQLYPRHAVDPAHVRALVLALESGAELPPVVADKKSLRIVDGWHRVRSYRRMHGATATVDAELVSYKDEAAMRFDAVRRNASHGRRLDRIDQARCVLMLRESGFNDEQIGTAINAPAKKVEKLAIRVATAPAGAGENVPGTRKIVLKRSVRHLAGTKLTKPQAEAHAMLPGTSLLLVTRQLAAALRHGLANLDDKRLVEQLRELRDLLIEHVPD